MSSFTAGNGRIYKRVAAGLAAAALAIAAPAALAASTSTSASRGVVHAKIERSGTVLVSGYDGGAPVTPAP
jgi:hypothetical protein